MPESRILILQEELEGYVNRQNELLGLVQTDNVPEGSTERDFTPAEEEEFDTLTNKIMDVNKRIKAQQKRDNARKQNAAMKFVDNVSRESKEELEIKSKFSVLRAIKSKIDGTPLTGVEAEVHQEAVNEARAKGESIQGIGLPSSMMSVQKRDLTVGTAATAGNLVATDLGAVVPALTPRLKVIELGATVLSGLTGNLDLPIGNAQASASWAAENATAAETTPTTTKLSLTPNRLAAFTNVSKQLMIQSSSDVENWVRTELSGAVARAVDLAAINGSGASNQPTGVLNTSGIGDVAMGTNGGVPTFPKIVDLETEIAKDNADVMNMAYLTTPGVRGVLKAAALSANNAGFIWDGNGSSLNGYNAQVSTQVPSDLDKGTSTGVCHAIIFGNWADLIIANWGIVDIVVDQYTLATTGQVRLIVNSYWDIGIKHAESFAAIKDATLS